MKDLFMEDNQEILYNFEILFDRAKNENTALTNAVDYYLILVEDLNKQISVEEIVDLAETYGYDFSKFESLIKQETNEL